jgi:hypothetical protein
MYAKKGSFFREDAEIHFWDKVAERREKRYGNTGSAA